MMLGLNKFPRTVVIICKCLKFKFRAPHLVGWKNKVDCSVVIMYKNCSINTLLYTHMGWYGCVEPPSLLWDDDNDKQPLKCRLNTCGQWQKTAESSLEYRRGAHYSENNLWNTPLAVPHVIQTLAETPLGVHVDATVWH